MTVTPRSERRFREGKGQRYLADGVTIRCQGVSREKLRKIRERENNPNLSPNEAWPEAQCKRAAEPGYFLCGGRLGHMKRRPLEKKDFLSFMPIDLREKLETVMQNPQILSRQFEMQQVIARILLLYDRIRANDGIGKRSLADLRIALSLIRKGDTVAGTDILEEVVENRTFEKEAYEEIYNAMALLKDLTRVEVSSMKDLRLMLGFDQVSAALIGVADTLSAALKEYIDDPRLRDLVAGAVARDITRRFNPGNAGILPPVAQAVEGEFTETK